MSVPPPNVKVYDRPDRTGPSPLIIAVVVLVVVILGFFIYKAMHHDAPENAGKTQPGILLMPSVVQADWFNRPQGRLSVFTIQNRL